MALIKCRVCGDEISDTSQNCPKCGDPIKPKSKERSWFGVLLIGITCILLAFIVYDRTRSAWGAVGSFFAAAIVFGAVYDSIANTIKNLFK